MELSKWQKTWNKILYGWDLGEIGTTLMVVPDVSHWSVNSEYIDEEKFAKQIKEKNIKAIIAKGTDCNRYTKKMFIDSKAIFWYKIANKFNLQIGYYHWLQQAVDPKVAFKFHNNFIKDYPTALPYIVDFEEPSVTDYSDYIWRLEIWTELAKENLINDDPIIYTGAWYLDRMRASLGVSSYQKKMSKFASFPPWFALYSRFSPKRYCLFKNKQVFTPWNGDDWVMWQYSDAADFPYYKDDDQYNGREWGISSAGLDMNLVKISWLQKYINNNSPIPEPYPDIMKYRITATRGLRIREEANTTSQILSVLPCGTIVEIQSIDKNHWGKLYGQAGYIYMNYTEMIN
jgi:GH25 family lysozyme M1 (1,4-beta-N-acetylmuramidase)